MAFLRSHVQIPKVTKQTQDFLILSFLLMFGTETSLVHFCCTLSSSWVSVELSTQDAYYLDASYSSQKHFQQHFLKKNTGRMQCLASLATDRRFCVNEVLRISLL